MRVVYSVLSRGSYLASAIDGRSRTLGHTDLLVAVDLEADAGRLAVLGVGDRDVRQMDRGFLGDDAGFLRSGLALMALHQVDATDDRAVFLGYDLEDFARTALVLTSENDDLVA